MEHTQKKDVQKDVSFDKEENEFLSTFNLSQYCQVL